MAHGHSPATASLERAEKLLREGSDEAIRHVRALGAIDGTTSEVLNRLRVTLEQACEPLENALRLAQIVLQGTSKLRLADQTLSEADGAVTGRGDISGLYTEDLRRTTNQIGGAANNIEHIADEALKAIRRLKDEIDRINSFVRFLVDDSSPQFRKATEDLDVLIYAVTNKRRDLERLTDPR